MSVDRGLIVEALTAVTTGRHPNIMPFLGLWPMHLRTDTMNVNHWCMGPFT